jgi:N utilization substance protein B
VKARSRARGWALQALYAWEARGAAEDSVIRVLENLYEHLNVSSRNRLYAEALVRLVSRNLSQVDRILDQHLTNWSLNRLSVIDRNVLRLGVAEMLFMDDVPPRVTIREMIGLAEKYGTSESPRFVNGVLDAVMRRLASEGADEAR